MKRAMAWGSLPLAVLLDFLTLRLALLLHPQLQPWDPLALAWGLGLARWALLSLSAQAARGRGPGLPGGLQEALLPLAALLSLLLPGYVTLQALAQPRAPPSELLHGWGRGDVFGLTYGVAGLVAALWHQLFPAGKGEPGPSASLGRLLACMRPDLLRFVAIAGFLVLSSLGEMAIPYYTGRMTDWIVSEDDPSAFVRAIWAMSLITVGSAVTEFVSDCLYNGTMNRIHMRIQSRVFSSVLRQEIGFFHGNRTGDITSRVTADTDAMSEALSEKLNLLMWYGMRGVFLFGLMVRVSLRLAFFTAVGLPLILLVPKLSGKFHQSLAQRVQESLAKANEVAVETFQAMATVRSFANEEGAARRYGQRLQETYRLNKQEAAAYAASMWTNSLSGLALKVGILYYGGRLVTAGAVSTGDLVTFVLYEMQFTTAVEVLLSVYPTVQKAVGSSEKIFEYMERTPQISPPGTLAPPALRGHLQVQDVWFSYPGRDDAPVLKGVSLELRPGEVTAVVGPSGAGKTALVALLERFYEPQRGRLLLDGRDLREYEHQYLHRKVALVSQKPVLFARSLHENIAYGLGGRSRQEVMGAARRANAHGFIARLSHGYDTDVGEMGGQISGGQRQGVAIARALLRDPRVLILDDATSALDTESQLRVEKEIYEGPRARRSVLLIAHRLSAVERADRILVLEDGAIREQGTHRELLARRGSYWRLVQTQLNGEQGGGSESGLGAGGPTPQGPDSHPAELGRGPAAALSGVSGSRSSPEAAAGAARAPPGGRSRQQQRAGPGNPPKAKPGGLARGPGAADPGEGAGAGAGAGGPATAMPLPLTLRLGCPLLLCDLALLALLGWGAPSLAPLGLPATWLEAAVRFLGLWGAWGLLAPDRPRLSPPRALAALCLLPPLYLTLRSCLPLPNVPPALLAGAPWAWLLLSYGAVGLAQLTWGALGQADREGEPSAEDMEERRKSRATLRRLVGMSWPDVTYISGAFVFLIGAVIGETFIPYFMGCVVDILGRAYDPDAFTTAIGLMCLASFGSSLSAGCRGGLFTFTIARLNIRLRQLLFSSLVRQDLAFFEMTKTGDLSSRLSTDTTKMSRAFSLNANVFLRSLVKALGIYYFMFSLSWHLTLLTLFETPITIVAQKIHDSYYQALLKDVQDSLARSGEVVREVVSSIETVRSFAAEDEESRRYDAALMETHQLASRRDQVRALYLLFQRLLQLAMQVLMLYCGHQEIRAGLLTKGSLVSFILYQGDAGRYVKTLVYIYGDLMSSVGAAEKVFKYLDREPAVATDGTLAPDSLHGHVSFRNVSFSYPSRPGVQVLKAVSLELRPGEVTALVGLNGSGKSTCVGLLQRFYEPQAGEILLDGAPLREYEHRYLHRQIALVGQEPILFAGSIWENIAYGLGGCGEAEVAAAACTANASEFIALTDRGFETDVGEKGGQLSAGQRQRIAIARALIRQPAVLILDEATSALDVDSEFAIRQSVLSRGPRTVLVIAHRMQTVENADRIVVLEGGAVAEEGTHAELMGREGPYYRLVQRDLAE
ncbi:ATP-dependent translocase ABCB1-like [Caretta caretta]|uniref:ATP-dependent translocase ABCB1-like n=1 Tax=Caretta caretta TaxID=8467 RepID=UPI003F4C70DC